MREITCPDCDFFDYDEIWDGSEEVQMFNCKAGNQDHIGWCKHPCELFQEKGSLKFDYETIKDEVKEYFRPSKDNPYLSFAKSVIYPLAMFVRRSMYERGVYGEAIDPSEDVNIAYEWANYLRRRDEILPIVEDCKWLLSDYDW